MPSITKINSKNLVPLAFILSGLYWFYLAFLSQMIITSDAIGYEGLGRMLYERGGLEYFLSGPNREPLYPLLISFAMRIADIFSVPYQSVQKPLQVLILLATQYLTLKILNKLNINPFLTFLCLLYIGFSPCLVNTAFSLYSEITTYPLILSIVLLSAKMWTLFVKEKTPENAWIYPAGFALSFIGTISVKGGFVGVLVVFAALFAIFYFHMHRKRNKKPAIHYAKIACFMYSLIVLFVVIIAALNLKYNGNFVLTDRGDRSFYVAAALRTEGVNRENFSYSVRLQPHLEFSQRGEDLFTQQRMELLKDGLSSTEVDRSIFRLAAQKIFEHPFSYLFFYLLQIIKMFFWESMRIGFVAYPDWLTKIFNFEPLEILLAVTSGILSLSAVIYTIQFVHRHRSRIFETESLNILFSVLMVIIPYVLFYSLSIVLPRFTMPIVPLYLILIAFFLQKIIYKKSSIEAG